MPSSSAATTTQQLIPKRIESRIASKMDRCTLLSPAHSFNTVYGTEIHFPSNSFLLSPSCCVCCCCSLWPSVLRLEAGWTLRSRLMSCHGFIHRLNGWQRLWYDMIEYLLRCYFRLCHSYFLLFNACAGWILWSASRTGFEWGIPGLDCKKYRQGSSVLWR